jgi:hypothetical protein
MHPMFVKLYLEDDPADMTDEEGKRRSAARSRRARSRATVRTAAPRDRDRRPER